MSSHSPRRASSALRPGYTAHLYARAAATAAARAAARRASNIEAKESMKLKLANPLAPTPEEKIEEDKIFGKKYKLHLTGRHSRGGGAGSKRGTQKTKRVYRSKNTRHVPKL